MLHLAEQPAPARRPRLHVGLAQCESEIREAQRLRYRIFAEELGARLPTRTPGIDIDLYDPYCEHLIVRDEANGCIVGTYRILSPQSAKRTGGYYSENEFDLTRLQLLRDLSPIHKLDRVKTPLLVMHGANDTNVPVVEAEQVVAALKKRNVPVEYVLFPDEGHGWRKQANRVRSTLELTRFFTEHLAE